MVPVGGGGEELRSWRGVKWELGRRLAQRCLGEGRGSCLGARRPTLISVAVAATGAPSIPDQRPHPA